MEGVRSSAMWNLLIPACFSASEGSGMAALALKMAILTWEDTSFTRIGGGREGVRDEVEVVFLAGSLKASEMTFWNWGRVEMILESFAWLRMGRRILS